MSAPSQPQRRPSGPEGKSPQKQPQRRHQHYRRTSAVIDERPDGKPIIFGYGRHLSKREKERVQRLIAYSVLAAVVAISVLVIAGAAVYDNVIYPNQSVASVNGHDINRHDRDLMAGYYSASAAAQGNQLQSDPTALGTEQLQKQLLSQLEAKQQFGIQVSNSEVDAALQKEISTPNTGGAAGFQRLLNLTGLSKDDYKRLILAPQVLRGKVMDHLTSGNPKVAEQWHYARIQVATKKAALAILTSLVTKNASFATLAKSQSTDTQTKTQGGDVGWVRTTDTTIDPLLTTVFLPTLKTMEKSHTKYKFLQSGTQYYVVEYLGHDLKRSLSATQTANDRTTAYNTWLKPLQDKAIFKPALPANQLGGSGAQITQPTTSSGGQQITIPAPSSGNSQSKPATGKSK